MVNLDVKYGQCGRMNVQITYTQNIHNSSTRSRASRKTKIALEIACEWVFYNDSNHTCHPLAHFLGPGTVPQSLLTFFFFLLLLTITKFCQLNGSITVGTIQTFGSLAANLSHWSCFNYWCIHMETKDCCCLKHT
jgi:hypothetical protein